MNEYDQYNPYGEGGGQRPPRKNIFRKGTFANKLLKVAAIAAVFGLVAGAVFQGSSYAIAKLTGGSVDGAVEASGMSKGSALDATAVSTATTVKDVSDIVENVMPSIVAVTNISYKEYRNFFGATQRYENSSAGSGIIVSQDNEYLYIATNNHVVTDSESITITFCDETAAPGTVKGTYSTADLAVVAVELSDIGEETMEKIRVATIGNSEELEVGSSAVVIGNALGYGQSVTTGVISALDRQVEMEDENGTVLTDHLIQTDAAVNPGNSGGALLNMNGEVIGIVSAKYADTEVEGMGYAIPITSAEDIIETLITKETVSEEDASYFGVSGMDVTSALAEEYHMPTGVYILRVASNSGAAKAGLEKGDVITSFNGRNVASMEEISNMMQYLPAGTTVEVTVAKADDDYELEDIEVTLTKKS